MASRLVSSPWTEFVYNGEEILCYCQKLTPRETSWIDSNPGRRYGSPDFKVSWVKFFLLKFFIDGWMCIFLANFLVDKLFLWRGFNDDEIYALNCLQMFGYCGTNIVDEIGDLCFKFPINVLMHLIFCCWFDKLLMYTLWIFSFVVKKCYHIRDFE